jgi:hypothetical protein
MRRSKAINTLMMGVAAIAALSVGACASSGGPRGGPGGPGGPGGGRMSGAERPSVIVRPGALLMVAFDADGDLAISRAEYDAGTAPMFARADANHDASITPIEFTNWTELYLGTSESSPGRLSFDTNADGSITKAEFDAEMNALFGQFDADKNGVITRKEMVQRLELGPQGGAGGPGAGGMGGGGRGRPPGGGPPGG